MAYASIASVKSRAGALSRSWTDTSQPSNPDLEVFLDDVAAEIDGYLQARGLTPPVAGSAAANALRGVNADGGLVLALEATFPEGTDKTIENARSRYEKTVQAIVEGTHPAVALLEATTAVAPSESNLWSKEPGYGLPLGIPVQPPLYPGQPAMDLNPYLAPQVTRGTSL